jgi:hypothetical protein
VLKLIFSLLLGGPVVALWPGRLPAWARKVGTCLALAPIAAGLVGVAGMLVSRPSLYWAAGPILIALGTAVLAGVYVLWPGAARRRTRMAAAVLYVGPLLGLFLLAGAIWTARGGTVVGKVTFQSRPVPAGKVSILSEDGVVCSGDIRPDGRYVVYRVPPGPAKFAVAVYPPRPPGPVPVAAPKAVPVPRRYRDFDTSGLTRPVTRGGQVQNIELGP